MNTKLFKLLTAGAFALLSACGDNSIEAGNYNAPVQTTATLSVLVKDAITNASLKASVKLSTGASDSTNASGFVYFKGIPAGDHRALIEKTGYASVVIEPHINSSLIENIYIATDATISAGLYPRTSGLEGYVLFEDKNGSSKPPTNATVRFVANTNLNLVDNVFEVPVSSTNGKFTFDSLPAIGNSYTLQVLDAATDGQKYTAKSYSGTALVKGTTVSLTSSIKYTAADLTDLFELTSFNSIIKSTDTLRLIFSDSIDVAKFKPDMITFGNNVTTAVEKIANGKTLKLVPADKWPSTFTFAVGNNNPIVSVKGKTYSSGSKTVYVDGTFELVSYKPTIKGKDTLALEFSDSIDAAKFRNDMITLTATSGTMPVVEKIVAGKILKLVPADNWPNSFSFTIGGGSATSTNNIVSVKGMTYYTTNPVARPIYLEGIFELVSYKNLVKGKDTLFLEFSDDIDAAKFTINTISFASLGNIVVDKKINGKQLILIPSGNWPTPYFTFTISSITSVNGQTYSTTNPTQKQVNVEGVFELVSYSEIVKSKDSLVLNFSDSLDTAKFKTNMINFSTNSSMPMPTVGMKVEGKQLILTPSSNWPSPSFTFTVGYNNAIVSNKGQTYSSSTGRPVIVEGTFDIVSYTATVTTTDTVFVEFSDSIDATRFRASYVNTNNVTTNKIVAGKTLKLVPVDKWPSTSFTFSITTDLLSVKGIANSNTSSKTVYTEGNFSYITHSTNIATTDAVVIEFNDNIDTNGIYSNLSVSGYTTTSDININWLSTDGKKLTLTRKSSTGSSSSRWNATSQSSSFAVSFNSNFKSLTGIPYTGGNINITIKGYPFGIVSGPASLDPATVDMTSPLIFEFSDSINPAQLNKPNTVVIDNVPIDRSIVDGKKLKIELAAGNRWPVTNFSVNFNSLTSVNNVTYSGGNRQITINMRNDLGTVNIEELKIVKSDGIIPDTLNYTSTSTYLRWKKVPFVGYYSSANNYNGGYRIYRKEGTGNFAQLTSTTQPNYTIVGQDTVCYVSVSLPSNSLADGKTVEFIVLAYNENSIGSLNTANKLTVKDTRKPTISGGYIAQSAVSEDTLYNWAGYVHNITNCGGDIIDYDEDNNPIYSTVYSCENTNWNNNTANRNEFKFDKLTQTSAVSYQYGTNVSLNDKYYNTYIAFSEPMDTNAVEIKYSGTKPNRFNIEKGWNTAGTQLYLNPVIAAGDIDNTEVSFIVHIANLKDRAGNDINVNYTISGNTITKNNIGFKFTPLKNPNL